MKKKRDFTRRRTSDYFLVYHFQSHQIIGRATNVSLGGLMLVAAEPLAVHQSYKLQLVFPRTIDDREWITFTAESRWSKFNSHADWWEIGFEIQELDTDDITVLQHVVHQLMTDESDRLDAKTPSDNKAAPKVEYIKPR